MREAYAVPARLGILRTFTSPRTLSALNIMERIRGQRDSYQARYESKSRKEEDYVKGKTYVQET